MISKNKMEQKQSIKKDMLLMDVVEKHPESAAVLTGYGLHCVGCHFSDIDTIESGAKIHGMDKETIEMMVKDLNEVIGNMKEGNK